LPGGGVLTVRPVATSDVDGLVALYDGLSDDDRYWRFFSGFRPPRSFFERLVNVRELGGYGLVATMGAGGYVAGGARIVGEASYELLPNRDGQLAIAVGADQRGWLGPYLLDALVEAAAARGVPNLEADVLVANGPMLALLRSRGDTTMAPNEWTTLRLLVGPAGCTPVWPTGNGATGHSDRPRVLVEVPGGRWQAQSRRGRSAGHRLLRATRRAPAVPGLGWPPLPAGRGRRRHRRVQRSRRRSVARSARGRTPSSTRACRSASSGGPVAAPGPAAAGGARAGSAVSVDEDQGPRMIVDLVDRLASRHRIAACGPPAPAPRGNLRF
jgi:hypothetical protein